MKTLTSQFVQYTGLSEECHISLHGFRWVNMNKCLNPERVPLTTEMIPLKSCLVKECVY